jgi:hypothetical protein
MDRGTPDLCIAYARKNKMWVKGLIVGDGMLGLPTLVHRRLGNLTSAATLRYTLFLKLQLKHRDTQPGRLEKRYAAGQRNKTIYTGNGCRLDSFVEA